MAKFDKDKRKALAGTILVHALALLALLFFALVTPLPLPGEEGVEVDLGYSDDGIGFIQPDKPLAPAESTPQMPQPEEVEEAEELLTQNVEEAPVIEEEPKEKVEEEPETKIEQPIEEPVIEEPKPVVNPRALFKGSSDTQNADGQGSEGITGKEGDQGNPNGLRDVKRYDGQGGRGNGPGFSLGGRGSKYLDQPSNDFTEQGNVVVDIWVDRQGNVKKAEINLKYTNIIDTGLRKKALQSAIKSTFAEDPSATELQKGTITYTFILRQ